MTIYEKPKFSKNKALSILKTSTEDLQVKKDDIYENKSLIDKRYFQKKKEIVKKK